MRSPLSGRPSRRLESRHGPPQEHLGFAVALLRHQREAEIGRSLERPVVVGSRVLSKCWSALRRVTSARPAAVAPVRSGRSSAGWFPTGGRRRGDGDGDARGARAGIDPPPRGRLPRGTCRRARARRRRGRGRLGARRRVPCSRLRSRLPSRRCARATFIWAAGNWPPLSSTARDARRKASTGSRNRVGRQVKR